MYRLDVASNELLDVNNTSCLLLTCIYIYLCLYTRTCLDIYVDVDIYVDRCITTHTRVC